jgi:hypothetical protein
MFMIGPSAIIDDVAEGELDVVVGMLRVDVELVDVVERLLVDVVVEMLLVDTDVRDPTVLVIPALVERTLVVVVVDLVDCGEGEGVESTTQTH